MSKDLKILVKEVLNIELVQANYHSDVIYLKKNEMLDFFERNIVYTEEGVTRYNTFRTIDLLNIIHYIQALQAENKQLKENTLKNKIKNLFKGKKK